MNLMVMISNMKIIKIKIIKMTMIMINKKLQIKCQIKLCNNLIKLIKGNKKIKNKQITQEFLVQEYHQGQEGLS